MAIKKEYEKSRHICNITFTLPEEVAGSAKRVHLVSSFNQWNHADTPMKKAKNGSFSVSVNLPAGKQYEFRYLLDGSRWVNDPDADKYVPTVFGFAENSVVII